MEQVNNINELKQGVLDGSIPSAVADSGATSSFETKRDRKRNAFVATGRQSDKAFCMPNCKLEEASDMDELQRDVRHPAKDVHIVPGIKRDSLLSIPKFADANYFAIFDKDKVSIYDANKTTIVVSRGAILQGWQCNQTNLWQVPLIKNIHNTNTDTVLCDRCPMEFLPDRPPPDEAIHNMYVNLCDSTTWRRVSQPNRCGSRPSKTDNMHRGWASHGRRSISISPSLKRH